VEKEAMLSRNKVEQCRYSLLILYIPHCSDAIVPLLISRSFRGFIGQLERKMLLEAIQPLRNPGTDTSADTH